MGLLEEMQKTPSEKAVVVDYKTADQKEGLKAMKDWWMGKDQCFVLSGEPGTGKTWLSADFVNNFPGAFPVFTAPTNEATRNLEMALPNDVRPKTTYTALGLKMSNWSQKQHIYQGAIPEDLSDHNLVVVDEASMVDHMREHPDAAMQLMDYVLDANLRVLWLGDDCQLPPVPDSFVKPGGARFYSSCDDTIEGKSPVFHQGYKRYHLREVVRHDGPILQYARGIREMLTDPEVPLKYLKPPAEIEVLTRLQNQKRLLETAVFDSITAGNTKIIAWTNVQVDSYNEVIRGQMFTPEVAKSTPVCPGDQIIFTKPLFGLTNKVAHNKVNIKTIADDTTLLASINTKAEVLKTKIVMLWNVECYYTELNIEGKRTLYAYVVTNAGQAAHKKLLNILKSDAIDKKKHKKHKDSKLAWQLFYSVSSVFSSIKHSYALTGHRAQGSTIPHVIVDSNNLLRNPDKLVGMKNYYVGLTRAAEELTIIRG